MSIRIVFMGSPEFALPSLTRLAAHYPVVGVVTQPDRRAGRGKTLTPPPVKAMADELGLETFQPESLRTSEALEQLNRWQPDVIVVAAFGQILKPEVLDLPPYGCINVHASLLPRWRGAAPIHAAILAGDEMGGVTIMKMDAGLDTGPTLATAAFPIRESDTAGTLSAAVAESGADLLIHSLPSILDGSILPRPQDHTLATYAPRLDKMDGELDFSKRAGHLARQVRAFSPWPGTYTYWNGTMLKVHQARAAMLRLDLAPGTRLLEGGLPAIAAADGLLILEVVQPAGKRSMSGETFLNGARNWPEA